MSSTVEVVEEEELLYHLVDKLYFTGDKLLMVVAHNNQQFTVYIYHIVARQLIFPIGIVDSIDKALLYEAKVVAKRVGYMGNVEVTITPHEDRWRPRTKEQVAELIREALGVPVKTPIWYKMSQAWRVAFAILLSGLFLTLLFVILGYLFSSTTFIYLALLFLFGPIILAGAIAFTNDLANTQEYERRRRSRS